MKKKDLQFSNKLADNIEPCDPIWADILKDCYETLNQRQVDGIMTFFEHGLKHDIEEAAKDGIAVRDRKSAALFQNFETLIRKKDENSWVKSEKNTLMEIEKMLFVDMFGAEGNMTKTIGEYAQSIMMLDFSQKLPTFEVNGIKKNVYNYFSFALESIADYLKGNSVSKKTVDAFLNLNKDVLFLVTDAQFKIRTISQTTEFAIGRQLSEIYNEHLFTLLPEFGNLELKEEFANGDIIKEPLKITLPKIGYCEVELSLIKCENDNEITEYLILIDRKGVNKNLRFQNHDNHSLIENIINGVKQIQKTTNVPKVKDDALGVLHNCYVLKERVKKELVQPDESRLEFNRSIIDFEILLRQSTNELRFLPGIQEVTIKIENGIKRPIMGSFESLNLILKNLISNAVQFRDRNKKICLVTVKLLCKNDFLEIDVSDNGIGMENYNLSLIFDKGYKTNFKTENLGYGLFFVKKSVDLQKGLISVESNLGLGTLFKIQLPLVDNDVLS